MDTKTPSKGLILLLIEERLPLRSNTVSTPDMSGAMRQKQIESIFSDAVYTGCDVTQQILDNKLIPGSISDTFKALTLRLTRRTNGFAAVTLSHPV